MANSCRSDGASTMAGKCMPIAGVVARTAASSFLEHLCNLIFVHFGPGGSGGRISVQCVMPLSVSLFSPSLSQDAP